MNRGYDWGGFLQVDPAIGSNPPESAEGLSSAARGLGDEVWVSDRTDGLGLGTAENPFDGSTWEKFDAQIAAAPEGAIIHILEGEFETHGITPKEGQRFLCCGEHLTTIKLSDGQANISGDAKAIFFKGGDSLDYFELDGVTLDLNGANQTIHTGNLNGYLDAVDVIAKSARVTNITVLSAYAKPGEGFPVHIEHDGTSGNDDFVYFENIKVIDPVGPMTAITFYDQSGGQIAGHIENCNVSSTTAGRSQGYGGRNWKNVKVLNNRASGINNAMTMDTEDFLNVEIAGNTFQVAPDVTYGGTVIAMNGVGNYDLDMHDNHFEVAVAGGNVLLGGSATTALKAHHNTFVNHGSNQTLSLANGTKGFLAFNTMNEVVASTLPASGFDVVQNRTPDGVALFTAIDPLSPVNLAARFNLSSLQNDWTSTGYKVLRLTNSDGTSNIKTMDLVWDGGQFTLRSLNDNLTQKGVWANFLSDGVTTQLNDLELNNIRQNSGVYHNWGLVSGSSGYGLRDNAGVVEVKNYLGSWSGVNAAVTRTTLAEAATLDLVLGSDSDSAATGTLTAITFNGTPSYTQPPTRLRLHVTGGPRTITIPASYLIGETSSRTDVTFETGYHEISWVYANGIYWMIHSGGENATVRVSTQFDKVNSTLGNVTGLSRDVVAGKTYAFRAVLHFTLDATGAGKVAIGGTATATAIVAYLNSPSEIDPGNDVHGRVTALSTAFTSLTDDNNKFAVVEGVITVNAGGTLTTMFAQNSANGTSSVLVGSTFTVEEVA